MEQRKIIFLDVDGTLVDYSGHIPQSAAEAFPELKAGTWGGAGETALFGDLALKEIDKAYAMDVLLEHLHASPDATVAFGDAKVDSHAGTQPDRCSYGKRRPGDPGCGRLCDR